jgi:hypothetical protein
MFTGARERVAFWWESCGPLWKVAGMIYAIFGALTLYRDNFMSPEAQKRYATMTLLPKIAWSYWVLALVVIFVGAILEGTFRAYKRSGSPSQPLDPFLPADPLNVLNCKCQRKHTVDRLSPQPTQFRQLTPSSRL